MTDYKFAGDFSKAPIGPFTAANKKLVWNDPKATINSDFDPDGSLFSIVADDRFPGGRACRLKYPEGQFGMQDQQYQVLYPSPRQAVYIEFQWLFEAGFSFHTPNESTTSGGKIGPCIQWGKIDGPQEGTRPMIWWNGSGSNYPPPGLNPVFSPSCQDQATGKQWIQPVVYTARIETERLYSWKIGCMGGPGGWAKYWLDGELIAEVVNADLKWSADDDVYFDFAYFSGGASPHNMPEHDSYARHGGCRIWTGSENWDEGNGEGSTGEGGDIAPTPPPTTPSSAVGSFTVTLDGKAYSVTGSWTLTPQDG